MRPDVVVSSSKTGSVHKCTSTIDGKEYVAQAASKKLARKEIAEVACKDLYNVIFDNSYAATEA